MGIRKKRSLTRILFPHELEKSQAKDGISPSQISKLKEEKGR